MSSVHKSEFVKEKHDLLRKIEGMNGKKKDEKKMKVILDRLEELEDKIKEEIQGQLEGHKNKIVVLAEKFEETKKPELKITKQYRELCAVYKEADILIKEIRETKKSVRDHIKEKRESQ